MSASPLLDKSRTEEVLSDIEDLNGGKYGMYRGLMVGAEASLELSTSKSHILQ